jgi:branched-chain amino acid transport system permease protein
VGFLPATLAAVGFVALLAALVGLALVRLSPDALPLATLGLLIVVFVIANNWTQITNGSASFYGLPSYTNLWSAFAFAVAAMLVARVFRDSRLGVELRASRNDELAASSTGVDVFRVRYAGWVLSAAIVAAGGSLYAHSVGVISPNLFSFDLTFAVLTIVIIGGQSVSGALVGALVATTVTEILRRVENNYTIGGHDLFGLSKIGSGLMILIVLALRPGGLLGRWELDEVVGRTVRLRLRPNGGAIGRDTHS